MVWEQKIIYALKPALWLKVYIYDLLQAISKYCFKKHKAYLTYMDNKI